MRIAAIATPENEEKLVAATKLLSNRAIETFVRDEKQNGLDKPQIEGKSVHVHTLQLPDAVKSVHGQTCNEEAKSVHLQSFNSDAKSVQLNEEVTKRLAELQGKGIDINEIITSALNKREAEISEEKDRLSEEAKSKPAKSRARPAKIEKLLTKEHGTKCSIPTCDKPSTVIHHTQIFALSKTHDPNYLAPLCDEHHEIAHAINLKVRENRFSR